MFQTIRYRLLLSYLAVFTSILGVFAIAVRVAFTHSLTHQLTNRLVALGHSATANAAYNNGQFNLNDIGEDFTNKDLTARHQAIQWFNLQGQLVAQRGKLVIPVPLAINRFVQIHRGNPDVQAVTLPILASEDKHLVGYVRVSQSLKDVDEALQKLDFGLGGGVLMALLLSGIGGIWLTRQAMQPIEESFQRLKQFTADASHELRSPLMAIKSNASVALKYAEGMRPRDTEKFDAILSATNQMTRLTEDLLLLARTENRSHRDRAPVNLTAILTEQLQLCESQALAKAITLKSHINRALMLKGDAAQLTRLFSNLIVNAINYTPVGGTIELQSSQVEQMLTIDVKDTGIGIAPENLGRVFDRFWRVDQSRSYWQGGSGLGLAIAQAIAQSHGGSITVTSQLGVGSCFSVHLPVTSH